MMLRSLSQKAVGGPSERLLQAAGPARGGLRPLRGGLAHLEFDIGQLAGFRMQRDRNPFPCRQQGSLRPRRKSRSCSSSASSTASLKRRSSPQQSPSSQGRSAGQERRRGVKEWTETERGTAGGQARIGAASIRAWYGWRISLIRARRSASLRFRLPGTSVPSARTQMESLASGRRLQSMTRRE